LQNCRVSAAFLFQTIAAESWHPKPQKPRNHAGIPSKIEGKTTGKTQEYISLRPEKRKIMRRSILRRNQLPPVVWDAIVEFSVSHLSLPAKTH